ncbi:response regulator [Salinimicrobium gaetbulicola]|uniref:Response regulator n=1 Tax=Salinimicrobium gaetbulicola TaxID=999702 RepID=A0ABW3ID19_9FLAO
MKKHYILVDDDVTNNLICEFTIKKFDEQAEIRVFTNPELALESLKGFSEGNKPIMFLDLNMPTMTGWEFLEYFNTLDPKIKDKFSVYILTSALDNGDMKHFDYPFLKGFLSKPLQTTYLENIVEKG